MLSRTVSRDSALVSWKVRTMPRRATLCAAIPPRSLPSKDQLPSLGLSKPVSRLKKVVLPAPLGPISAVMTPRCTSRCSTSTAVRPPKRRVTPSATRIGSGLGTPGRASTAVSASAARRAASGRSSVGTASAGIERQLLLVSEDPLRAEDHERHQQHTHQDEAHDAD